MPRPYSELELKIRGITDFNKYLFFGVICVLYILILFMQQTFIIAEIPAFQFAEGSQMLILKLLAGLKIVGVPLMYGIKFTVVGFILWTGCFMWGYKVSFAKCWQVSMIAELVFFVPAILKTLWFILFQTETNYWEFQAFYPLSMMAFFDYAEVAPRYLYVNKSLNLFEVAYWVVLTYGIDYAARKKKSVANAIVFTTYVPLFFFWLWFYAAVYD
jgi:hypothetical protein